MEEGEAMSTDERPGPARPAPPEISTVEVVFTQEGDTWSSGNYQGLTVKAEDAGAGHFLVISTERWALDIGEIDAFAALPRRVARMAEGEGEDAT